MAERLTPGDAPPWFWWAVGMGCGVIGLIWLDYFANLPWIWRWLTGGEAGS